MSRAVLAAAVLGILSTPVVAQRGMHASGRASMGFAPARTGFARAPQMRPSFVAPRPTIVARPRTAIVPQRRGVITFGHINGGPFFTTSGSRHFDHHFHHRTFVYALPYYGAYWPYFGDYSSPYYSSSAYSDDAGAANSYYTDLSGRVNQLDTQVNELQDENDSLRSALDEQRRPAAPVAPSSATANEPAAVLIFRDGHRTEVQNYAIVGSTLWMLSPSRANKVPLSDLDLDQTVKANEERGLSFSVPKSGTR